jgi:hypothetical protein
MIDEYDEPLYNQQAALARSMLLHLARAKCGPVIVAWQAEFGREDQCPL